jgi:hypothetical protein
MTRLALLLPLLAALAAPAAALATQPAPAPGPAGGRGRDELSFLLILDAGYGHGGDYESGFGLGGRYRLSLAPQGVIRPGSSSVRDSIDLEFGGDLVRYDYHYHTAPYDYHYAWWALRPRLGVMWDFWINPQLALYPKLDLGYEFGWFDGWEPAAGSHPHYDGLFLEPAIGLIWRFRPATSLRVELGTQGLKLGLGFAM